MGLEVDNKIMCLDKNAVLQVLYTKIDQKFQRLAAQNCSLTANWSKTHFY